MAREEIKKLIEKAVKKLYGKKVKVKLESRALQAFGDYASNIGMLLKKDPQEITSTIKSVILEKVEIKNGFINFFLSKEYLQRQIEEILKKKDKFGELKMGEGEKVNVEFISANPTGELHLGHGRGAFFGDTLANILQKAGHRVVREYYINDAKNSVQIKELGKTALDRGTTYLTDYLKIKIKELGLKNKKSKSEGEAGYDLAQLVNEDIKRFIGGRLKIKFDRWVSEERDLYKKSKVSKVKDWIEKKKLSYKKDGALWLKTSKYGDVKDWVIVRESGEATYLLSDLAYHKDKFDRKFGKVINIWGADHQGHVGKIKAAGKILGFKGDLDILISQVVRLKKGKISKRKGEVVTLDWLLDEVGLDVARFFYLMKSLDTQMEFDVELAKEKNQKSPVYYVQYAHARICSILRKSEIRNPGTENLELLKHPSELELIKQLIRFPEIIEDTAKDYQVQRLPQYAIDLATVFHQFYRDCRVISGDKELTKGRLSLVLATKIVFKNILSLMGISAPEKM